MQIINGIMPTILNCQFSVTLNLRTSESCLTSNSFSFLKSPSLITVSLFGTQEDILLPLRYRKLNLNFCLWKYMELL